MATDLVAIFDMDGVLVDTIQSLFNTYLNILHRLGKVGSRQEFDRLNGCNLDEIVAHLTLHHDLSGREDAIREHFETAFANLYSQVDLVDGAMEVLQTLRRRDVTLCLASSAGRHHIEVALERFQLRRHFSTVVSGDDVERAKPHPDIYRLAKERCPGREHFVIEDSTNGVTAARRAGLVTLHFDPTGHVAESQASYPIRHLSEVPAILLDEEAIIVSRADRIEIRPQEHRHSVSAQDEHHVDALWSRATDENPSLFNGEVACYLSHRIRMDGTLDVTCFRSRYKYALAQLQDPSLSLSMPIGVSAILEDAVGNVLLGRRAPQVTEYGGYFELAPSGSITPDNMSATSYLNQIVTELVEETAIGQEQVETLEPFCLIYDRAHQVFDICVRMILNREIDPAALESDEYSELVLLQFDSLEAFFEEQPVIPTSKAMLRAGLRG